MKVAKAAIAGVLALSLAGCAGLTKTVVVHTDPADAVIFVNGEEAGQGEALVTGVPQQGNYKFYHVAAKRDGYRELSTQIENEIDWSAVGLSTVGGLALATWAYYGMGTSHPLTMAMVALGVTSGPFAALSSYGFKDSYHFKLERDDTDPNVR